MRSESSARSEKTTAGDALARPVPFPPEANAGSSALARFCGLRPWDWVT